MLQGFALRHVRTSLDVRSLLKTPSVDLGKQSRTDVHVPPVLWDS